ncbi:protein PRRC1-like [Leptinotarsa decemlineata]
MGLVKEAFSSGGVLSKMAEKAKSSVDSIITTLDPQMSEFINSGGDTEVTVISENEEEVSALREAFHSVFGKAWVNGMKLNVPPKKFQAVGFEEGKRNAEEKIEYSFKYRKTPTVAIENILLEQNGEWFELSILVLKDTERQITVQTFSQATPVPVDEFLRSITPENKTLSTQEKLASIAQAKGNWQQHISGVSRKEVILLAAKTLVSLYKNKLSARIF